MSVNNNFSFSINEAFAIAHRGITFRGEVISGFVDIGADLFVDTPSGQLIGKLNFIVSNQQLIGRTIPDVEIGLLVVDFNDELLNQLYTTPPEERNHGEIAYLKSLCILDGGMIRDVGVG